MGLTLTETDQASIALTLARLERDLIPAGEGAIYRVVAALLAIAPQRPMEDEVAEGKLKIYASALDDIPLWALQIAARKWTKGECDGKVEFAPSPGQLRRLAVEAIAPHRAAIAKLRRLQSAKPLSAAEHTPETRQRVAAKFGDLINSLTKPEGPSA